MSGDSLKDLAPQLPEEVTLYPYEDIPEDEWPVYGGSSGEKIALHEGWRDVGYVYPYPDVKRTRKLRALISGVEIERKKSAMRLTNEDPEALARYLARTLIKGVVRRKGKDKKPVPEEFDRTLRDWLFEQLMKSEFLLTGAYTLYLNHADRTQAGEEEEKENFHKPSETSSGSQESE